MRRRVTLLAAAATVAAASLLGTSASSAATDPTAYGAAMSVTFGTLGADAMLPVSVDLPAPDPGEQVTAVTFSWIVPLTYNHLTTHTTAPVPTPDCEVGAACHVDTSINVANASSSQITVNVYDGDSLIGTISPYAPISQSYPTVELTSPAAGATLWGTVTLTADATPNRDGRPIKDVRFYFNPTGSQDDAFVTDDAAPYSVDVPASDLWGSSTAAVVYAVAEDVDGRLSRYDRSYAAYLHKVDVGPPAQVDWVTPTTDGHPAGYNGQWISLDWHTAIPDNVPNGPTSQFDPTSTPYIDKVEILVDGKQFYAQDAEHNPSWASYAADPRLRAASDGITWDASNGLTPGLHEATLRVTTSYHSVAETTTRFIITDGVTATDLTMDGHPVKVWTVVTAGTTHKVSVTVSGRTPGSALTQASLSVAGKTLATFTCADAEVWTCPSSQTLSGTWTAPTNTSTTGIDVSGQESQQSYPEPFPTTPLWVQTRTRLTATASSTRIRSGARLDVTGRLVNADTSRGVTGIPVRLQWRKAGTTAWTTVVTGQTGRDGSVTTRPLRRTTGAYRFTSPGIEHSFAPATSNVVTVHVR